MSHDDSQPHISIEALMQHAEEGEVSPDVSGETSPSSAFDDVLATAPRPRELRPLSSSRAHTIISMVRQKPSPQELVTLHQDVLEATLPDELQLVELFDALYATDHTSAVIKMWQQIDARDIPRRHLLLPLIVARATRAREQVQSAALQTGSRLAHPIICQVAMRMFETSSHKVQISAVQVMHTFGDRTHHYFLSQQLEHRGDLDSALVIAIRRALAAIAQRHPIKTTEGGALSLSSQAEGGALSLAGQVHDPKLDTQLEERIAHILAHQPIELLTPPPPPQDKLVSADPGFLSLKSQEHQQLRVIRTVLYNEYTNWRMSVAAMAATLILQFVITILYHPLFTLAVLGLLPMFYDRKIRHADALRQIVFGDRIAHIKLDIPARSTMATATIQDEEGTSHKRYFPLSSSLEHDLKEHPDQLVHVAWHPEQEDAYLVEAHDYLTIDEHGSLALAGRSKAWLVRSLAVLNLATYAVCIALFGHGMIQIESMLTTEAVGLGLCLLFGFGIQHNRQTNTGRFTL